MADAATVIPLVQVGGESLVSASYANKLITPLNALLQGKVAPIANIGSMKYAGGEFILDLTAIDARLRRLEAVGATATVDGNVGNLPFGINDVSTNNNAALVNIRYATVSGIVPNGIASAISVSANTTLYLNITIDNNATVTAASVNTGSVPSPNTSTKAYSLIGSVTVASNVVTAINQALLFSQTFVACGRNITDPTTTPGTYYLQVS